MSLLRFGYLDPIWTYISHFIGCLVETRNYSILFLAFIASSFRVTEGNLVFETVQSGPHSSFALKGTHFYILLVNVGKQEVGHK